MSFQALGESVEHIIQNLNAFSDHLSFARVVALSLGN